MQVAAPHEPPCDLIGDFDRIVGAIPDPPANLGDPLTGNTGTEVTFDGPQR